MTKKSRAALLVGAAVTALATVSACGSGSTTAKSLPAAPSPSASVAAAGASATPAAASAGTLAVRDDPELQSVVTDGRGMTLYVFDKDTAGSGTSACTGECSQMWHAVPADNVAVSQGLNQDLLGSITRTDGTKQLTIAEKPVYYYGKDTKPGDSKGQGVGGEWYASAPDGWKAGVKRPPLGVLNDPKLGKVLQDKDGRTLYLFTKDTPWPMKTACGKDCLAQWTPTPVVTPADAKEAGIPVKALFTYTTPNGKKQESFNCYPGYSYHGDTLPGQTNGQNSGDVWFAIKQDITKIDRGKTIPAAKAADSAASQGATDSTTGTTGSDSTSSNGTGASGATASSGGYSY